jgi:hypothetical protein
LNIQDPPFQSADVETRFASVPAPIRSGILGLRQLIFQVAAGSPNVGPLHETLKWGQPAYLTSVTKSGTTLRLGLPKQGGFAIYVHCQTSIVSEFRTLFPDDFTYEGSRAIHFTDAKPVPLGKLRLFIHRALTYHLPRNRL